MKETLAMWNELTSPPDAGEVLSFYSVAVSFIFAVVFVASGFYSARPGAKPFGERYSRRFIRRSASLLGWISGVGLFLLLIRYLQINPLGLGLPIWTLLVLIALVAAIVVIVVRAASDREIRRRNQAGHRRSRRPARRARR